MSPKRRTDVQSNEVIETQAENTSDIPKKERLSIPLTESGAPDWDSMKTGNRARVEQFLASHGTVAGLPNDFKESKIKPEQVVIVYDALASAIRWAGTALLKWPSELTKHIKYSDEQKEMLKQPTADLFARYSTRWMLDHQELMAWAMAFGTATEQMITQAVQAFMIEQLQRAQAVAPNGHGVSENQPSA